MDTDAIRSRWREKLRRTSATRLSVPKESLAAVLADRCPEQFERLRDSIAERKQASIVLPPADLQWIVDYEPEPEPKQPTRVPRQRKAKLDDQSDAGAD